MNHVEPASIASVQHQEIVWPGELRELRLGEPAAGNSLDGKVDPIGAGVEERLAVAREIAGDDTKRSMNRGGVLLAMAPQVLRTARRGGGLQ